MKNTKKFGLAAVLLLVFVGVVCGQYETTRKDIFDVDPKTGIKGTLDNPTIDRELLLYSMYAENQIKSSSSFGTPFAGKVGAYSMALDWQFMLATKDNVYIRTGTTGKGSSPVSNGCKVYAQSWGYSSFPAGNTLNITNPAMSPIPLLPDLSGVVFPATQTIKNNNIVPGSYGDLSAGKKYKLKAGTYYFTSITLGVNDEFIIEPDEVSGSYKTVIYVQNNILINGSNVFIGANDKDKSAGQITFLVKGNITHNGSAGTNAALYGTYIVPNGTLDISTSGCPIYGQVAAKEIVLKSSFNGGTGIIYVPPANINVTITPTDYTFLEDKNWNNAPDKNPPTYTPTYNWAFDKHKHYDTAIVVSINADIGASTIKLPYEVKTVGANVGATGTDAVIEQSVMKGEFTLTNTKKSARIPVRILDDGDYEEDESFEIVFDDPIVTPSGDLVVNLPRKTITMTIKSDDPNNSTPTAPTYAAKRVIEWYSGIVIQDVAELATTDKDATDTHKYQIKSVVDKSGTNRNTWFSISGNKIITTTSYEADYEVTDQQEFTFKVVAIDSKGLPNSTSPEAEIKITISPWNDKEFVLSANNADKPYTITVAEDNLDGVTFDGKVVFESDDDLSNTQNKQVVVGISESSAGGRSIVSFITTTGKGIVSVSGDNITYKPSTNPEDEFTYDEFYYTIIDTAHYDGYDTRAFSKTVKVAVTITPADDNPPVVTMVSRELPENSDIKIAIGDIEITDADKNIPEHYNTNIFVAGSTAVSGSVAGATVRIEDGILVYDLTKVLKPVEVFSDVITYKVKDTKNEATGTINITIKHKNDIPPVAVNDNVTAYVGVSTTTSVLTENDTDADVVPTGKTADIVIKDIVSQPSNSKITVAKIGNKTVNIKIDPSYNPSADGITATFTYNIQDPTDYDTDVNTSVNVATVTITIEAMSGDVPIPEPDTIIVNEGGSADALWNGIKELIANDKESKNGAKVVEAERVSNGLRGQASVNPDGTFNYRDNGTEFPFSDGFYYKVKAENGEWSVIDGYVLVIINPLNDHEPALIEKQGRVNVKQTKTFTVINSEDSDIDYGTILKLASVEPIADAEVSVIGDNTVSFKYNGNVEEPKEIKVYYWVKDSVDYTHYYNNADVFAERKYNEYTETRCSLIVTVLPNPKAVKDSMTVKELNSTNEFVDSDGNKYYNVLENDLFLSNVKNYTVVIKDNPKNGELKLNSNSGTAVYTHKNPGGLTDEFSYYLISTLDDGTKDTTVGIVVISISSREPYFDTLTVNYKDVNADGKVDMITIPFDREVDIINTIFDVFFGTETTKNAVSSYAKNEDGTDNRKVVILMGFNASENTTGGIMQVQITHSKFIDAETGDAPVQTVYPIDEAAPVIKSASYTKTLVPGGNDTLVITMSEISEVSIGAGNLPFEFIVKQNSNKYFVSFDKIINNNDGTYTLIIGVKDSGKIADGDSVFVNPEGKVKDFVNGLAKNEQINPDNKRVPIGIKTVTKIISAIYIDTNVVRDGWVDLIKIELGMKVDDDIAQKMFEVLKPNLAAITRKFSVSSFKITESGIDLSVIENKDEQVKTDLYADDSLAFETSVSTSDGLLTVKAGGVKITDGVAPVILYAQYTAGAQNNLDVVFSEAVSAAGGNPYKFYQVKPAPGRDYGMTFEGTSLPAQTAPNILQYKVISTDVPYPVGNDSIWIMQYGIISDKDGNIQDLTVRAPLKLTKPYPSDLELFIVPQPLHLIKMGSGYEPKALNQSFMDYYKIQGANKGVAVVLEAKGPVTDPKLQRGVVRIIDQTGNAVTDELEMKFTLTDRGTVSGVVVWDGKNRSGRNVGAATYLAIVNVEIQFDDREAKESRAYQKIIAVTTAKDMFE